MANSETICVVYIDEVFTKRAQNEQFASSAAAYEVDDGASHHSASFHGTPAPQSSVVPVLRITTDHEPKDCRAGFVFGRDAAVCDVLLDDPTVSGRQFSLPVNFASGTLLLKNLSVHGTRAKFHKLKETVLLKSTRWLGENELVQLSVGDNLTLQIERYNDPLGWNDFFDRLRSRLSLAQLRLSTNIETTNASQRAAVYIPNRPLGAGANAQVFKAFEKHTGNVYAMKLYNKARGGRWQEPEILERLRHKYVVSFVRYTKPAHQPAELIMELVTGATLQTVLDPASNSTHLDPLEAREVLRQVLAAVAYLHSHGVMHRDLKPANIMIQQRDPVRIKLVDFGEAKRGKQFSRTCGTPLYAAPEINRKLWPCTDKVDMFSIGVMALQLFYGLPTYLGEGEAWSDAMLRKRATLLAVAAEDPAPESNSFVCGLLCENPHRRPSARASLRHDFFRASLGTEVGALAGGPVTDWPTQIYMPTIPPLEASDHGTGEASSSRAQVFYDEATSELPDTESWGNHSQHVVQPREEEEEEDSVPVSTTEFSTSSSHVSRSFNRSGAPARSIVDAEVTTLHQNMPAPAEEGRLATAVAESAESSVRSQIAGSAASRSTSRSADQLIGQPVSQLQDTGSESELDYYYEDCWFDPLHDLGGSSFAAHHASSSSRHHRSGQSGRRSSAKPPPSSGSTPILQDAIGVEDGGSNMEEPRDGAGGEADGEPDGAEEVEGPYAEEDHPDERPVRRRRRTSAQEKAILEALYLQTPRPGKAEYERLTLVVPMSKKQLQIWFQNRRQQDRHMQRQQQPAATLGGIARAFLAG